MPVTSASTERANSTLKHLKTKERSSMSQATLNAVVLGYKHKDLLANANIEELTNNFIRMKRRRVLLSDPTSE